MNRIIFGAQLEKNDDAVEAVSGFKANLKKPEAKLFFSEAQIKSFWGKNSFLVVGVFENAMPKIYYLGFLFLFIYLAIWFFTGVQSWVLYILALVLSLTYFFWTPTFYSLMFRAGLRKANYKGKVKVLYADRLAFCLLETKGHGRN